MGPPMLNIGLDKVLIMPSLETLVVGGTSFDTNLPLLTQYLMLMTKGFVVEVERIVPMLLHLLIQ